jgi:eukaryotic-like serine/threonine-protein kinase
VQAAGGDDTPTDETPDRQTPSQTPSRSPSESPSDTPSETPSETTPETPTETTPTETTPTETVEVDAASLVGRDVKDVEKELEDLGLEVATEEIANPGDQGEGIVASVEPSGSVEVGETVVVTYYGKAPDEGSEGQGNGSENGQLNGQGNGLDGEQGNQGGGDG